MQSPKDAMPWVGLYVAVASLVCTLAMAADLFQRKLWFPCRFFTLNAASITLIAIAMKLPVDLSGNMSSDNELTAKSSSFYFLFTMLANFLPSLGLMDGKELLINMVALAILIITIIVNLCIQMSTKTSNIVLWVGNMVFFILLILLPFSVALTVPTTRRILERQYRELHRLASNHQEIKFFSKELKHHVKKYWMMAETGNPQFVIACSPFCYAYGVICSFLVYTSISSLLYLFGERLDYWADLVKSDYKWSLSVIIVVQTIGTVVGSITPIFRCFIAFSFFDLSRNWSMIHLNMFRMEKHWTQMLREWKRSHVRSHIPGRHCKKVFHNVKNMILNFCIALHITVVVICKTIRLITSSFVILFSWCFYFCKSLLKMFKEEPNTSTSNVRSEIEEYTSYVLQIEEDVKISKRLLRNALNSITRFLHESEKKEPSNLMKLLEKSTGFNGVVEFNNDQVPPLVQEETQNCWSLVATTLTAVAIALPNILNDHVKGLLAGMSESLQFVRHIEESVNANDDLVKARKTARRVWTEIEVYSRWLQIDLQKKAGKGKTSKEILQWLGDEAVKTVIHFKRRKNGSMEHSLHKFIAASSMYRISQTIMLHYNGQENWPKDEEVFEWISTIIADVLWACLTNLPRVIAMKCHDNAIEKRKESIRTAAELLGKSKKILSILEVRQLPSLDLDSMAYIDEWHAMLKSKSPIGCASSSRIQRASLSCNESHILTIV